MPNKGELCPECGGFANRDLREQLVVLTGQEPNHITQGKMTYDLRRLRLHGMIEKIPKTHRYRVTVCARALHRISNLTVGFRRKIQVGL